METERMKFGRALEVCLGHADALQDALNDLGGKHFSAADLLALSSHERRLLDQFAYRFTRLQDDMGGRLFPALLGALGEEVSAMAVIDRLNRLEQLGWIPLADEWLENSLTITRKIPSCTSYDCARPWRRAGGWWKFWKPS